MLKKRGIDDDFGGLPDDEVDDLGEEEGRDGLYGGNLEDDEFADDEDLDDDEFDEDEEFGDDDDFDDDDDSDESEGDEE